MASNRIQHLETGIFSELAQQRMSVAHKLDVIDLSVGSPDLSPPQVVIDTLLEHTANPSAYGYTLTALPSFKSAVAQFYDRRYSVQLDANSEVVQLMGSQDGLAHLAMALANPGDYVLAPNPGYPIYHASVSIAGALLYPMPLLETNSFLPNLEAIPTEVIQRTKLMILNYPGNPVTALAPAEFFEQVVSFAKRHNIIVAHDFAYSELVFDGNRPVSFLSIPGARDVGIEFNSLSKTFNMAGCRIGYVVGNPLVLNVIERLKSHVDYGIFYPIQKAAEAALLADDALHKEQTRIYESRRDTLTSSLEQAGWPIRKSPATMFIWAKVPTGHSSRAFAFGAIERTGVIMTPGNAFGNLGEGYVRLALVQSEERLKEAAQRLKGYLSEI